jgi:hypothetical protein
MWRKEFREGFAAGGFTRYRPVFKQPRDFTPCCRTRPQRSEDREISQIFMEHSSGLDGVSVVLLLLSDGE